MGERCVKVWDPVARKYVWITVDQAIDEFNRRVKGKEKKSG